MAKEFQYLVENTIVESNQEFKEWLNDWGDIGWELINVHIIREEWTGAPGKPKGTREVYYNCIFKREKIVK